MNHSEFLKEDDNDDGGNNDVDDEEEEDNGGGIEGGVGFVLVGGCVEEAEEVDDIV